MTANRADQSLAKAKCPICQKEYQPYREWQVVCSPECRTIAAQEKRKQEEILIEAGRKALNQ